MPRWATTKPAALKSTARFPLAFVVPDTANRFLQSLADEVPALMQVKWSYNLVRSASYRAADVVAALNCVPDSVAGLVVVDPDVPVGINNRAAGRIAAQSMSRFVKVEGGTVGLMRGLLVYRGAKRARNGGPGGVGEGHARPEG